MQLDSISIKNFKGIRDKQISFNPDITVISGPNASGKTSILDAFLWCLTGKDSLGRAEFPVKPFGKDGVEPTVKVKFDDISFKRILKEVYSRSKKSGPKVLTGHKTQYFVDDQPVTKRDFDERINEIVPLGILPLLVNPRAFADLHWQDQRKIILDLFVDDDDLAKLDEFNKRVQALKSEKTHLNKILKDYAPRLDELHSMIQETDINPAAIEAQKEDLEKQLIEIQKEKQELLHGGKVQELKKTIAELEAEKAGIHIEVQKLSDIVSKKARERKMLMSGVEAQMETASTLEDQIQALRDAWFEARESATCEFCGQKLPEDKLQETLDNINAKGKKLKEELEKITADIEVKVQEGNKLDQEIKNLTKRVEKEKAKADKALKSIEAKIKGTEKKIATLQSNIAPEIEKLDVQKNKIEQQLNSLLELLAQHRQQQGLRERIEKIQKQQKEDAKKFDEIETEITENETWIKELCESIETEIQNNFWITRFKFFKERLNGCLENWFEIINLDGVPWSGINNGQKINIGLDIINALNRHYGKPDLPIWIDNAESVQDLLDMESQTILLVVPQEEQEIDISLD